MGVFEQKLLVLVIVAAALPLILSGIAGRFYKPAPMLIGALLTWVSLFAIWEETISYVFRLNAFVGFSITASFFLGSFLATIAGGIYLLVVRDRQTNSGEEHSA